MKVFDAELFCQLNKKAALASRKRVHMNIHDSLEEPVQRVLISLSRGTYVPPHYHCGDVNWELICVLDGHVKLIIFDEDHRISSVHLLGKGEDASMVQLGEKEIHTLICLSHHSTILEIKEGPYKPAVVSNFVEGFPKEGRETSSDIVLWMENAEAGDQYSG